MCVCLVPSSAARAAKKNKAYRETQYRCITKSTKSNKYKVSETKMKEFTTVLFGSTGLIGKQAFERFLFPEWYLFIFQDNQIHFTHHIIIFARREINIDEEIQLNDLVEDLLFENYTFSYSFHENVISYFFQNKTTGQIVTSKIVVQFVIEPDSGKWKAMLPAVLMARKKHKEAQNWKFSIVSSLGSTAYQSRKSGISRDWVENTLNQDILTAITGKAELRESLKQFIIVTSFNNKYLSQFLPYFQTKASLEAAIKDQLQGEKVQIVIFKPGPLIGSHGKRVIFRQPELRGSLLGCIMNYKKAVVKHYFTRIKEWPRVGFGTRGAEFVASMTYGVPGSSLLGYPVKSSDVAKLLVYSRLITEKSDSGFAQENRTIEITSENIDKICRNDTVLKNIY